MSRSLLFREIREITAPISKEGIEAKELKSKENNKYSTAAESSADKRDTSSSTVIISGGYAVWELDVDLSVLETLVDMTLRIETIRTHGMLHSKIENKTGSIFLNGFLVDKIQLAKPHLNGYGVNSRRPYPVLRYINREQSTQVIKIETEDDVLWDIDQVILEPIIQRKEIKPESALVIGTILSWLVGILGAFIIS